MPKITPKFEENTRKRREARTKNINDSTLKAVTTNICYEEYFDFNDMQQKLFTNNTAEKWAKEIIEYAQRPTVFKITQFFIEKGIEYTSAMALCEQYEILGTAYKHARYIVGNRREMGGLKNELNAGLIHATMAMYDPEHKAHAEWKAKLAQDNQKAGPVTVLIERYPNTAIVPEKLSNKEQE